LASSFLLDDFLAAVCCCLNKNLQISLKPLGLLKVFGPVKNNTWGIGPGMECSGISLDLVAQSLKYQQLFFMLSLSPTWRRLISALSFFSLFSWHLYNVK
jgi:hypothetical protein